MDKKQSILNISVSVFFKVVLLLTALLARRCLIQSVGNDVNGINSLYLSIIGVLSVVELGVGDAIIYCMYKPIVEKDTTMTAALYNLFKRLYMIIGIVIAIVGCAVMPFVPHLAKGYTAADINLYLTFILMLMSTVLTYFFSAKISLINAYKNNYIATTITSIGTLLQHILQIGVILWTKSYAWYLACRIVAVFAQWGMSEVVTRKKYAQILKNQRVRVDNDTKGKIIKNVKAMFLHRVGSVLVNTIDSIIISAFIGVAVLGKYSNYITIMTAMTGILVLFFQPLTSTIGHLFVQDNNTAIRYYSFFSALNFALGCVFFLGYYAVIDDLIILLFGTGLEVQKSISFVITINYFVQFMRQSTLLFRDASGTFYYDRWKPLAEGVSNLILSIVFVVIFQKVAGDDFALIGVIVATILTNVFICHVVEPYVLHKHAFHTSAKKHYIRTYSYMAVFVVLLVVLNYCMIEIDNKWAELLINGSIAVGISLLSITVLILINKDFKRYVREKLHRKHQ